MMIDYSMLDEVKPFDSDDISHNQTFPAPRRREKSTDSRNFQLDGQGYSSATNRAG